MDSIDINTAMFNIQEKKLENLSSAKLNSKRDEELKKAAQDFEAVFINQLLQVMDSTIQRNEGYLSEGRGGQMFRSMLNEEIAKSISKSPNANFGFAQQIYEQMKRINS